MAGVPAAIQTTGWFPTNRIGLSPASMTGMLLDFQMPAGINGIERMPTTTQDQTLYAAECSTQPAELKYSRPELFALDPAKTACGQRAHCDIHTIG